MVWSPPRMTGSAPEDAENYTSLGCVLYDQQRFAEAEAALHEALRRNPHDTTARTNLNTLRTKQNRR